MEPADAKDLIDEAIERAEESSNAAERIERDHERRFRDRISLMVGGFAVALAIVHMNAAGAQRESLLQGIAASDSFAYMQAKIVRETVLKTLLRDRARRQRIVRTGPAKPPACARRIRSGTGSANCKRRARVSGRLEKPLHDRARGSSSAKPRCNLRSCCCRLRWSRAPDGSPAEQASSPGSVSCWRSRRVSGL